MLSIFELRKGQESEDPKNASGEGIAATNVRNATSSYISPGKTYANCFQSALNSKSSSIIDEFLKLALYFMEPKILTIEQEIEKFFLIISVKCEFLIKFNVRSLVDRSRQIDLINTVYYNNIDICFVQESYLSKNTRISFKD